MSEHENRAVPLAPDGPREYRPTPPPKVSGRNSDCAPALSRSAFGPAKAANHAPMGSAINRGLTFRMAQTLVERYLPSLLKRIEEEDIDPSFVIIHCASLEDGPELCKTFREKKDGCIKVVMKP